MLTFILTGDSRFKSINKTVLIKSISNILLLWALVIYFELGLKGALMATILASLIQIFVYLSEIFKFNKFVFNIRIKYFSESLKYSLKSWIGTVTTSVSQKIDQFFVGLFINAKELGIYGMGIQFADFILFVPSASDQIFFNKIAELKDEKNRKEFTEKYIRVNFWFTILFSLFFITGCYFSIPYILGEAYKDSAILFLLYSPGVILWIIPKYITKYFAANNQPEKSSYVTVFGIILIPIILIPSMYFYGVIGIAFGSSVLSLFTVFYCIYLFNKNLTLNNIKKLFSISKNDIDWAKSQLSGFKIKNLVK